VNWNSCYTVLLLFVLFFIVLLLFLWQTHRYKRSTINIYIAATYISAHFKKRTVSLKKCFTTAYWIIHIKFMPQLIEIEQFTWQIFSTCVLGKEWGARNSSDLRITLMCFILKHNIAMWKKLCLSCFIFSHFKISTQFYIVTCCIGWYWKSRSKSNDYAEYLCINNLYFKIPWQSWSYSAELKFIIGSLVEKCHDDIE
jgi:hypothetical protein